MQHDAGVVKDLVGKFANVLKQVLDRKLSRDFDYHKVPAPWMQIKLLKLLALIGADDQTASEAMYEVIRNTLVKAESQGSPAYVLFPRRRRARSCLRLVSVLLLVSQGNTSLSECASA